MTVWLLAGFLFLAGLVMLMFRRNLLAMLMGLELMISAANVGLVSSAGLFNDPAGAAAVLLIIAVAAAEAVVGLSLILRLFRDGRPADSMELIQLAEVPGSKFQATNSEPGTRNPELV